MVYYTTMKKQYSATICALCAFFCAGAVTGCNSTPVRPDERAMLPVDPAHKTVIERRAAALKKVISAKHADMMETNIKAMRIGAEN